MQNKCHLEVINLSELVKDQSEYMNTIVSEVNDHALRIAVINGEFHWHKHEDCDELFYVLEGELYIDLEDDKTVSLKRGEVFTVPANTMHRTRSNERTINLCFEKVSNDINGKIDALSEQLELPRIEGRSIDLRYVMKSDLDAYFTIMQDEELTRLTGSQGEFTRGEIAAWIQKIGVKTEGRVDFMIVVKETNELVGEVVLNEFDSINRSANIRIAIQGTQHRGKGYGTEAMIQMLRYGFETLKLHRIHLGVYSFNPRAIHVYEKIGFQREGIQRDTLFLDGEYHDMIMMAILEDDFRSLHGSLNYDSLK